MTTAFPETDQDRNAWVVARRGARNQVDVSRPYAFLLEDELSETGRVAKVATIFLTNRECPWRCVMCDLWKNTIEGSTPAGAIPAQIDFALSRLPPADRVKLYNSGSFFDRSAIPVQDWPVIAKRLDNFQRVIIECHPKLINEAVIQFRDLLAGKLEIAMGLETAHPETLARLNKRMTLEDFSTAARFLSEAEIALRTFVLVKPPFQSDDEALTWCRRSVDFAFECGSTAVSLIPTRFGNGSLEALAASRAFSPPSLALFEKAFADALSPRRGRVFSDVWDLEKFSQCPACFRERKARLDRMNLSQRVEAEIECSGLFPTDLSDACGL